MTAAIVYSPEYDLYLPLLEHVHPFDGRKYSRAYNLLRERVGLPDLDQITHQPRAEPAQADLLLVHTEPYLSSLASAEVLARVLEIPMLRWLPSSIRQQRLLHPMRLAVEGTIEAVHRALSNHELVFQFGGGFHHAFAGRGEGFCVFADAAIGIQATRSRGLLTKDDTVLVIDLDAHRGNGIEDIFKADPAVRFFDIYNFQVYPGILDADETEAPYIIPIKAHTIGPKYLDILYRDLPRFLQENKPARLSIYNAGTDVLEGDPLGQLKLSEEEVLERDRFVIDLLAERGIPTVILPSGGYTSRSHALIAETARYLLERYCHLAETGVNNGLQIQNHEPA